jgi:two-component system, NarL family, invasion response regulator UvrY
MKKTIRVMITDDHPLYRKAASAALDCLSCIEVVSLCASGLEAIESIPAVLPDIIMMDIHMQPMDGIEATAKIKALYPDIKIIGFSLESQPHIADLIIKAGASGYVTKSSPMEEICEAVKQVQKGKKYICKEIKMEIRGK